MAHPVAKSFSSLSPAKELETEAASQLAYVLCKRAVIRLDEQRAFSWGKRDSHIVSIFLGLFYSPTGVRKPEVSCHTKTPLDAQPVSRRESGRVLPMRSSFCSDPM
jgi:hypothetical protein